MSPLFACGVARSDIPYTTTTRYISRRTSEWRSSSTLRSSQSRKQSFLLWHPNYLGVASKLSIQHSLLGYWTRPIVWLISSFFFFLMVFLSSVMTFLGCLFILLGVSHPLLLCLLKWRKKKSNIKHFPLCSAKCKPHIKHLIQKKKKIRSAIVTYVCKMCFVDNFIYLFLFENVF